MGKARLNQWAEKHITAFRQNKYRAESNLAIEIVAHYRDAQGNLIPPRAAAVELINIIRPIVAISAFVVFSIHALITNRIDPRPLTSEDRQLTSFVQEVRRHYPFFPSIAAYANRDVEWRGFVIPKDAWVILDVYGTNHDDRTWKQPDNFILERFRDVWPDPWTFIPQGGGDTMTGHRCPGEQATVELIKTDIQYLLTHVEYDIPPQNLHLRWSRLPPIPLEGLRLRNIRLI